MPSPSFHKLVLPSTLQAKKLRLPDDFVKQYGGNISSIVTLTVPDGSIWRVGLKKEDNKFWLLDGWHDFVQHYSIGIGYLLLFRYEGRSCFIVNIYSFGTSEINYESPAQSSNEAPHRAKHLAILEDVEDEDLNLGEAGNTPSSKSAKSPDNQMTRDKGLQFNEIEFEKSTEEVKLRTATDEKVKRTRTKKRKSDVQERPSEHEDEVEMRNSYESASARKRTVTDEERKRARNEAEAFEPSNPFCRVILRPSYLYRGCIMYLPSCFAEKHLNGISDNIKLQISDGEQWSVRCVYKDGKAKLSQGWFDFALENNLGEGDVCVFERLAAEEVVLHVTFFRITEDE